MRGSKLLPISVACALHQVVWPGSHSAPLLPVWGTGRCCTRTGEAATSGGIWGQARWLVGAGPWEGALVLLVTQTADSKLL